MIARQFPGRARHGDAFEDIGAIEFGSVNLTGLGDPERLDSARVNVGFFRALAVPPVAGRLLVPVEDAFGRDANVVILSHRFWARRFARGPAVVSRTLTARRRGTPGDRRAAGGAAVR